MDALIACSVHPLVSGASRAAFACHAMLVALGAVPPPPAEWEECTVVRSHAPITPVHSGWAAKHTAQLFLREFPNDLLVADILLGRLRPLEPMALGPIWFPDVVTRYISAVVPEGQGFELGLGTALSWTSATSVDSSTTSPRIVGLRNLRSQQFGWPPTITGSTQAHGSLPSVPLRSLPRLRASHFFFLLLGCVVLLVSDYQ